MSGGAPTSLGSYRLGGLLGQGNMARVFRAVDPSGREVAVKVIREARNAERLLREGQLAARLDHPGILPVHAAGQEGDSVFLVYPLVEGAQTLEEVLPGAGPTRALELLALVADALAYAHELGVVHRDVKPENVLVDDEGNPRLADFGVALALDVERLTQTGGMVGTPLFMAPEQLLGHREKQGPPADVWSLGVMLYRYLSGGEFPHDGSNLVMLLSQLQEPPRPLGGPPELERLCRRALSYEPADRPTAAEFAASLRLHLRGGTTTATGGLGRIVERWPPPATWLAGGAVGLLAALALAVAVLYDVEPASSPPERSPIARPPDSPAPAAAGPPSRAVLRSLELARNWAGQQQYADAEREYRFALAELDPKAELARTARDELAGLYQDWVTQEMTLTGKIGSWERLERLVALAPDLPEERRRRVQSTLLTWAETLWVVDSGDTARLLSLALSSPGSTPPLSIEAKLARLHLNCSELSAAEEVIASMAARDPKDARAHALRAELCLAQGKQTEAEAHLATATSLPGALLPEVRRARAVFAERRGELRAALEDLEVALQGWDRDFAGRLLRVRIRRRLGDYQVALNEVSGLTILKRGIVSAHREQALILEGLRRPGDAAHSWGVVANRLPEDPVPLLNQVDALVRNKESKKAELYLSVVEERFPDHPGARLGRIKIKNRRGEWAAARTELLDLLNGDGPMRDHLPALLFFAERSVSWTRGWRSPRHAIWAAERYLRLDPDNPRPWEIRGVARGLLEDWRGAYADAKSALKVDPADSRAFALEGNALVKLGRASEGLVALDRAVELDANNIYFLADRASAYRGQGRWREAVADLRAFLAVANANHNIWTHLGESLSMLGDYDAAEEAFQKAIEFEGKAGKVGWQAFHYRGLSRERAGDLEGARRDLEQALRASNVNATRGAQTREALRRLADR